MVLYAHSRLLAVSQVGLGSAPSFLDTLDVGVVVLAAFVVLLLKGIILADVLDREQIILKLLELFEYCDVLVMARCSCLPLTWLL